MVGGLIGSPPLLHLDTERRIRATGRRIMPCQLRSVNALRGQA